MMPESITTLEHPMAKRIRVHKGGRPRSNRPAIDHGTEELRIKRASLVGSAAPELASYPLGIMLARGIIGQDQHNAGLQYASLYGRAIGRYRDCGIGPQGSEPPADEALEATEALFRQVRAALIAKGRRTADAVDNACVYQRLPRWLGIVSRNAGRRVAGERDREALIDGLNVLVAALIGRKQARAAE